MARRDILLDPYNVGAECGATRSSVVSLPTNAFTAMRSLLARVENPIIFDGGAFIGAIAKLFRGLFPTSTVYSFEPCRETFASLEANVADDPKIRAFNFGLSDRDGTQPFYLNESPMTNSLLASDDLAILTWGPGLLETQTIDEAQFRTIDSVLLEMNIPRIDLLKLDVQGAEGRVMSGASGACGRGIIGLVYSEIITQPTYRGQKRFDKALAPFYDSGFDLYNCYHGTCTSDGRLRAVDAIFTKTNGEGM